MPRALAEGRYKGRCASSRSTGDISLEPASERASIAAGQTLISLYLIVSSVLVHARLSVHDICRSTERAASSELLLALVCASARMGCAEII